MLQSLGILDTKYSDIRKLKYSTDKYCQTQDIMRVGSAHYLTQTTQTLSTHMRGIRNSRTHPRLTKNSRL